MIFRTYVMTRTRSEARRRAASDPRDAEPSADAANSLPDPPMSDPRVTQVLLVMECMGIAMWEVRHL